MGEDLFQLAFLLLAVNRCFWFFFFNDTATTEIYTLSLHDALPICNSCLYDHGEREREEGTPDGEAMTVGRPQRALRDRKSTRLNSSHTVISYAVFCLKKKNISLQNSLSYVHEPTASVHNPPQFFRN